MNRFQTIALLRHQLPEWHELSLDFQFAALEAWRTHSNAAASLFAFGA